MIIKHNYKSFIILLLIILDSSCKRAKIPIDLLVFNSTIYTVDKKFSTVSAMAIKEGEIIETGDSKELKNKYSGKLEVDGSGKFVYPGFYDAHCHFYKYGISSLEVNLSGTKSWDEVLNKLTEYAKRYPNGWLKGRGWDQNDWLIKEFPDKSALDSLFPERPCFLKRIDGHAAVVNSMALAVSGITLKGHGYARNYDEEGKGGKWESGKVREWESMPRTIVKGRKVGKHALNDSEVWKTGKFNQIEGGEILYSEGELTGVLLDNAMDLVEKNIPEPTVDEKMSGLLSIEKTCFSYGLTTVADAGLKKKEIDFLDSLHKTGKLRIKIYAMADPDSINLNYYSKHGIYKTELLHVSAFKLVADGALGSRGACLKKDYSDQQGNRGFLLQPPPYFKELADKIYTMGFQMNTHCIGDSANSFIFDLYGEKLKTKNDKRWRIEHAQVIDTFEINKFFEFSIIPSIQFTHATSDMYWAKERLGEERMAGAYAYKKLLNATGIIANGSDFPVEKINPLLGFYAGVTRKDTTGFPENGFYINEAVTHEDALKAMTIWAAYSCFEEKGRGSLEKGKAADFVILEKNLMQSADEELYKVKVLSTFVNGVKVYDNVVE